MSSGRRMTNALTLTSKREMSTLREISVPVAVLFTNGLTLNRVSFWLLPEHLVCLSQIFPCLVYFLK